MNYLKVHTWIYLLKPKIHPSLTWLFIFYSLQFKVGVHLLKPEPSELLKVHIFWEGHKILRNLHRRFVLCSASQIYSRKFAKFCGLLRIYELLLWSFHWYLIKDVIISTFVRLWLSVNLSGWNLLLFLYFHSRIRILTADGDEVSYFGYYTKKNSTTIQKLQSYSTKIII